MVTRPRRPARLHVVVLSPDGRGSTAPGLAAWLTRVAPRTAAGEMTVALVSDRRMRSLNRTFRGVDAVTDVLSFPAFADTSLDTHSVPASARSAGAAVGRESLGDVVIATAVARRQAKAAGHALGTELRVLALHGLLHLLGFDHETDDGRMARTEARLRRRGELKEGLIERTVTPARPARRRGAR